MRLTNHARFTSLLAVVLVGLLAFGCDREPEDLEKWRNAQNGPDQLAEWASSDDEPDDVRKRAIQILVEEGETVAASRALGDTEDDEMRQQLADAAIPSIEEMWDQQDFPEVDEETQQEGGQVAVGEPDVVLAVDAISELFEHFGDDARNSARDILRDWISEDQQLRTQIADDAIPHLLEYAGDDSVDLIRNWIIETPNPHELAADIRRHGPTEAQPGLDDALVERAEQHHPDLDQELQQAIVGNDRIGIPAAKTEEIVPYLETALQEDETDQEFVSAAIQTSAGVGGEGFDLLADVIAEQHHPVRWLALQSIVEHHGLEGLVDVADALPEDPEDYHTPDDDSLHQYVTQICAYSETLVDEDEIDDDTQPIADLMEKDRWPAQLLGLRCAGELDTVEFRETVQALEDEDFELFAWGGESETLGDYASTVDGVLGDNDEE